MPSRRQRQNWRANKKTRNTDSNLPAQIDAETFALLKQEIRDELTQELSGKTAQVAQTEVVRVVSSVFSGPTPSPEVLEGYRKTYPEAPKRIFDNAEKEQDARLKRWAKQQFYGFIIQLLGLVVMTCFMLIVSYLGYRLIESGHSTKGFVAILGALVLLVGVAYYGHKSWKVFLKRTHLTDDD